MNVLNHGVKPVIFVFREQDQNVFALIRPHIDVVFDVFCFIIIIIRNHLKAHSKTLEFVDDLFSVAPEGKGVGSAGIIKGDGGEHVGF